MSAPVHFSYICSLPVHECVLKYISGASGAPVTVPVQLMGFLEWWELRVRKPRSRACLVTDVGSHSFCPLTSSAARHWPQNAASKSLRYGVNAGGTNRWGTDASALLWITGQNSWAHSALTTSAAGGMLNTPKVCSFSPDGFEASQTRQMNLCPLEPLNVCTQFGVN